MNTLDKQYQALLQDILDNGTQKGDRTGTGTISVFGRQIRHKMSEGFPLLTTKKMYFKGIVTELLWFLRGDTNIKYLVDNDCHIWVGDSYKNYCKSFKNQSLIEQHSFDTDPMTQEMFLNKIKTDDEFAKKWGELGPVYGKQWREWTYQTNEWYDGKNHYDEESKTIDQISNLIHDLKTNPDSRRLMVNAWNVGELENMVLPPCHYGFQVYTRELNREERWNLYSNRFLQMKPHKFQKMLNGKWVESTEEEDMFEYDVFHIPTRAISLMWNQRSVDTFLGLPFNIASYGLLLEIIAKEVNMVPDELIGNLGDVHLYSNHIEQAKEQIGQPIFEESPTLYPNGPMNEGIKKQIMVGHTREPYPLPKLDINDEFWNPDASLIEQIEHIEISDFHIEGYQSHPAIKAPLSN